MNTTIKIIVFLCVTNIVQSARILGVFPIPVRSHRNLYSPLMQELVKRGHDVTVISPFEEPNRLKNGTYRDIVLKGFTEWMQAQVLTSRSYENIVENNIFVEITIATLALKQITEMTLADENVQNLLKSDEKFDVVIISEVLNRAHRALAARFGSSLVLFSTIGASTWVNPAVGNPTPTSYVPDIFLGYQGYLTFCQRLLNSVVYLYLQVFLNFYLHFEHDKLIKKYIPNGPDIDDVLYNVSLVLLNSHPSLNQPVPHVPNMIEIGGFHIKPPKKLPQDLQEYLDNAPDGVIYFSLGSNLKSSNLSPEKREALLKTFAKLKQNILWKWEEDVLPNQPANVKVSKWLPQQDILAHPNIKLFITHGGLLSTTETIYHGIPVLAIPIYGDQKLNAEIMVRKGIGLSLSLSDLTEEKLTKIIGELLNNEKYYTNAKHKSTIFHDRLVNPMKTAIYWIEYIIRHQGASHLRVAALDLVWYQYLLLDVALFIVLLFLLMFIIAYIFIRAINLLCFKSQMKIKKN